MQDSKIETYSRMWQFMKADPHNFVDSNDAGVKRVNQARDSIQVVAVPPVPPLGDWKFCFFKCAIG